MPDDHEVDDIAEYNYEDDFLKEKSSPVPEIYGPGLGPYIGLRKRRLLQLPGRRGQLSSDY